MYVGLAITVPVRPVQRRVQGDRRDSWMWLRPQFVRAKTHSSDCNIRAKENRSDLSTKLAQLPGVSSSRSTQSE